MTENQNVSELVNEWLHAVEYRISRSTYVKYEQLTRNYISPFFESMTEEELDNECLNHFCSLINEKETIGGRQLSIGNRRTILMIVNNALDYAYDSRALDQRYYIRPRLSRTRKVVRVFSRDDQKKIEEYILCHEDACSLAIMLSLFTGLRLGEICALQWKDICFETSSLYVNKTVQRLKTFDGEHGSRTELLVSQPKSAASNRLIPLPSFLLDYMRRFPEGAQDAYLLTNDAKAPMEPRTLQYHYQRILQKIGVPYLNFHCLRHTFATRCVTLGWDMKTLSEVLGHFDIKITMEYYFHSSFEYKQMQMSKVLLLSQN
ncbi:MAG: site-specific integrase [Clostridiales bacterium]|nr:site-specific integrase [Clostridiales bacterium]